MDMSKLIGYIPITKYKELARIVELLPNDVDTRLAIIRILLKSTDSNIRRLAEEMADGLQSIPRVREVLEQHVEGSEDLRKYIQILLGPEKEGPLHENVTAAIAEAKQWIAEGRPFYTGDLSGLVGTDD